MQVASLRKAYGETLVELGRKNEKIVVLDADLAKSTHTYMFGEAFPDRFFDMGISEQDMMATAAGLAASGKIVFASTFAVFATGRAWDQIRIQIAYSQNNVKIVATHGGISVGEDGYTHQAIEDIALMRVLPGMRVIVPADANATRAVIKKVADVPGPFYVRLTRPPLPIIYEEVPNVEIGKGIILKEGKDVTLIAIGAMVYQALEAAKMLETMGITAKVIDMVSVKPLDEEVLLEAAHTTRTIVTCEDHSVIGGLGSAVAEVLGEKMPTRMYRVGIRDTFGVSGSPDELYEKFQLKAKHIVEKVTQML
ncbi:transketolase family protein [candidate division WOR-3 bacterium]|nr:transketolase family protein [candidate division WOR-3 bacterium]